MLPGRTIVIGTEQGLYCRVHALAAPRLVVSAVTEDGQPLGPHELDLRNPRQLLECASAISVVPRFCAPCRLPMRSMACVLPQDLHMIVAQCVQRQIL